MTQQQLIARMEALAEEKKVFIDENFEYARTHGKQLEYRDLEIIFFIKKIAELQIRSEEKINGHA